MVWSVSRSEPSTTKSQGGCCCCFFFLPLPLLWAVVVVVVVVVVVIVVFVSFSFSLAASAAQFTVRILPSGWFGVLVVGWLVGWLVGCGCGGLVCIQGGGGGRGSAKMEGGTV